MDNPSATRLETIFRSATLCRTLGHLVLLPETAEARIEDLVAVAEVTRPAVLDALTTLQDAGLATARRDVRRLLYRFERSHPLSQPLIALFEAASSFEPFGASPAVDPTIGPTADSTTATIVNDPPKARRTRGVR